MEHLSCVSGIPNCIWSRGQVQTKQLCLPSATELARHGFQGKLSVLPASTGLHAHIACQACREGSSLLLRHDQDQALCPLQPAPQGSVAAQPALLTSTRVLAAISLHKLIKSCRPCLEAIHAGRACPRQGTCTGNLCTAGPCRLADAAEGLPGRRATTCGPAMAKACSPCSDRSWE